MYEEGQYFGKTLHPLIGEDVHLSNYDTCLSNSTCKCCFSETCLWKSRKTHSCESVSLTDRSCKVNSTESQSSTFSSWENTLDVSFVCDTQMPLTVSRSRSWEELFSSVSTTNSENRFIKDCEIFINDRHAVKHNHAVEQEGDQPETTEQRQKFQRFRKKKYICDDCDRSFTLKQNVQQHYFQYHHPAGDRKKPVRLIAKRFQCTKCHKIFKTLEKAQRHEERLHGEKVAPTVFVCPHPNCNKIYSAQSQLKEHVDVVHEQLRPFACDQCEMKFGRAGGLRRHVMMVHSQIRHKCPYPNCDHPGYKCTKALAAHIRSVHTLDRPFSCLFCEKTFVRKNDLKVHEMTHSSQCEYTCEKCGSLFRRLIYLHKHEKRCIQGIKKKRKAKMKNLIMEEEISKKVDEKLISSGNCAKTELDLDGVEKQSLVFGENFTEQVI